MYTTLTEREIDELKISLLEAAKKKLIRALKGLDIEGLTIHERGGQGRKSIYNDRRMVIWIRCEYEGREYWITLFESEIDPESGNCHTQYGKIMFVKDLVKNYSSMSSPNQICDRTGESVFLRFESGKWKTPFPLGDREYVTAGDVMENDTLADEIAEAFAGFVKEQEDGV
ncbi:MAG: hypothetical protein K6A80_03365 [Saccharofermentans sp.]|nr:hypothetical protein [Saccharofermentans sp.]